MEVYRALCQALPVIPAIVNGKISLIYYFSQYIYMIGVKTHREFQKLLKGQKNQWLKSRHEIYSVPFVEMLPLSPDHKKLISQSILAHHKDFETIQDYLYTDQDVKIMVEISERCINPHDFQENLNTPVDVAYLAGLKQRLQDYYDKYAPGKRQSELTPLIFPARKILSSNTLNRY